MLKQNVLWVDDPQERWYQQQLQQQQLQQQQLHQQQLHQQQLHQQHLHQQQLHQQHLHQQQLHQQQLHQHQPQQQQLQEQQLQEQQLQQLQQLQQQQLQTHRFRPISPTSSRQEFRRPSIQFGQQLLVRRQSQQPTAQYWFQASAPASAPALQLQQERRPSPQEFRRPLLQFGQQLLVHNQSQLPASPTYPVPQLSMFSSSESALMRSPLLSSSDGEPARKRRRKEPKLYMSPLGAERRVYYIDSETQELEETPLVGTCTKGASRSGTLFLKEATDVLDLLRGLEFMQLHPNLVRVFATTVTKPAMVYLSQYSNSFNDYLKKATLDTTTRRLSMVSAVMAVLLDQYARLRIAGDKTFPVRLDSKKFTKIVGLAYGGGDRRLHPPHRPVSIASLPYQTVLSLVALLDLHYLDELFTRDTFIANAEDVVSGEPGLWFTVGKVRLPPILTLVTVPSASFGQNDATDAITTRFKAARTKPASCNSVGFQAAVFRGTYADKNTGRDLARIGIHNSPAQRVLDAYRLLLEAIFPILMECMPGFFQADNGYIVGDINIEPVAYDGNAPPSNLMNEFLRSCPPSIN